MLTLKQEKFVQNIINGMTQRQAYKEAYAAEKMKDEVVDVRACELFNNSKVKVRYQELMERLEDKAIMSARERMKWLSDVVAGNIKETVAVMKTDADGNSEMIEKEFPSKLDTKLRALDTLNKMSGEYVEKVKVDQEKPFEVNITVVK